MRKKLLTLAGAMALFSNVSMVKAVEDMNWGVKAGADYSVMGGVSYKAKDAANAQEVDKSLNYGGGLFFGYNFSEMFAIQTSVEGRMDTIAVKVAEQSEADKKAKKAAEKSPLEVGLTNVALDVLFRVMPMQYDGGCMFIDLGPEFTYALMKDVKVKGTKDTKADAIVKNFGINVVYNIGATFVDDMISAGIEARYGLLNQADDAKVKDVTAIKDSKIESLNFGRVKVGLSLGVNIAAMIA